MQFELFVAARYLRAKRRQAVIGVITVISVVGVAAGVASLIIALAINNGFRQDLQDRLLGSSSHINLLRVEADGIRNWQPLLSELTKQPHVIGGRSRHLRTGADLARSASAGRGAQRHHPCRGEQGQRSAELGEIRQLPTHCRRPPQPRILRPPTPTSPTRYRRKLRRRWRRSCSAKTWPTNSARLSAPS